MAKCDICVAWSDRFEAVGSCEKVIRSVCRKFCVQDLLRIRDMDLASAENGLGTIFIFVIVYILTCYVMSGVTIEGIDHSTSIF